MIRKITVLFLSLVSASMGVHAQLAGSYQQEIDAWHQKRIQGLRAENGWLNLVGLFWLEEGRNSFGTAATNRLVFPTGKIAAEAGYFERKEKEVRLVVTGDDQVLIKERPVRDAVIFHADSTRPVVVSRGSLRWTIIKREDKYGVRLRDLQSAQLDAFTGIDRYPVDSNWRVEAVLEKAQESKSIAITNVLGQTSAQASPGRLAFTLNGQRYTLDALEEGKELFIIFADETSGNGTYPSGRFVYAEKPGPDGKTILDFNKAYNPPCAFTPYATCPLPPKQNVLPVAVTAGEKNYGHRE